MARLTHRQYATVLGCVGEAYAHYNLDTFGVLALALVRKAVPSSYGHYNEFNARQNRGVAVGDPQDVVSVQGTDRFIWDLLLREQPLIHHYQRTGDGSARKLTDFLNRGQFHETALYREFFRHVGTEFQIAFYLPERPPNSVAIALVRDRGDFSESDRLMLNLLRPHLFQAYRNAETIHKLQREGVSMNSALEGSGRGLVAIGPKGEMRSCSSQARQWLGNYFGGPVNGRLPERLLRWVVQQQLPANGSGPFPPPREQLVVERDGCRLMVRLLADSTPEQQLLVLEERRTAFSAALLQRLGLTSRQAEVLFWIAQGKTNPEIGIILGLSAGTVHKHTEHIFEKLCVETRTTAAARAWELLRSDES